MGGRLCSDQGGAHRTSPLFRSEGRASLLLPGGDLMHASAKAAPCGTATLIQNVTRWDRCERCDDTGLAIVPGARVYDGHSYEHWAAPCAECQAGAGKLVLL